MRYQSPFEAKPGGVFDRQSGEAEDGTGFLVMVSCGWGRGGSYAKSFPKTPSQVLTKSWLISPGSNIADLDRGVAITAAPEVRGKF
jgi:hypothetical protein